MLRDRNRNPIFYQQDINSLRYTLSPAKRKNTGPCLISTCESCVLTDNNQQVRVYQCFIVTKTQSGDRDRISGTKHTAGPELNAISRLAQSRLFHLFVQHQNNCCSLIASSFFFSHSQSLGAPSCNYFKAVMHLSMACCR